MADDLIGRLRNAINSNDLQAFQTTFGRSLSPFLEINQQVYGKIDEQTGQAQNIFTSQTGQTMKTQLRGVEEWYKLYGYCTQVIPDGYLKCSPVLHSYVNRSDQIVLLCNISYRGTFLNLHGLQKKLANKDTREMIRFPALPYTRGFLDEEHQAIVDCLVHMQYQQQQAQTQQLQEQQQHQHKRRKCNSPNSNSPTASSGADDLQCHLSAVALLLQQHSAATAAATARAEGMMALVPEKIFRLTGSLSLYVNPQNHTIERCDLFLEHHF